MSIHRETKYAGNHHMFLVASIDWFIK